MSFLAARVQMVDVLLEVSVIDGHRVAIKIISGIPRAHLAQTTSPCCAHRAGTVSIVVSKSCALNCRVAYRPASSLLMSPSSSAILRVIARCELHVSKFDLEEIRRVCAQQGPLECVALRAQHTATARITSCCQRARCSRRATPPLRRAC